MTFRVPLWVLYALGSFLCYGITNAMLGAIYEWSGRDSAASVSAPFVLWLTMGGVGALTAAGFGLSGRTFKGLPDKRLTWVAVAAGVSLAAAMLTLKLGLAADPAAKGPIVAVTSCNAMIVALAAWLVFGESLGRGQWSGMLAIIGGIVVMALAGGAASSLRGLAFGLATMVLFGTTNFLLKYIGQRGGDSVTATLILWLAAGACGLLAVGYSLLQYGRLPGLERPALVLWAVLAGATLALGMLFLKLAVTRGPGGPATAVAGSNSVLVVLFEWSVFAHVPPSLKLVGMGVTLVGIITLSLAPRATTGPASPDSQSRPVRSTPS